MPEIRFLRSREGAQLAYTVEGMGRALVCVPPWTTHLRAAGAVRLSGVHR